MGAGIAGSFLIVVLGVALMQNPAPSATKFATIAEAWSAPAKDADMIVAHRLFSTDQLADVCARAMTPARLVLETPLNLRAGEPFALTSLRIMAIDESGRALPPIPLLIEVEALERPILDLRSETTADGIIVPIRSGQFMFRARAICVESVAPVFAAATVRQRELAWLEPVGHPVGRPRTW